MSLCKTSYSDVGFLCCRYSGSAGQPTEMSGSTTRTAGLRRFDYNIALSVPGFGIICLISTSTCSAHLRCTFAGGHSWWTTGLFPATSGCRTWTLKKPWSISESSAAEAKAGEATKRPMELMLGIFSVPENGAGDQETKPRPCSIGRTTPNQSHKSVGTSRRWSNPYLPQSTNHFILIYGKAVKQSDFSCLFSSLVPWYRCRKSWRAFQGP